MEHSARINVYLLALFKFRGGKKCHLSLANTHRAKSPPPSKSQALLILLQRLHFLAYPQKNYTLLSTNSPCIYGYMTKTIQLCKPTTGSMTNTVTALANYATSASGKTIMPAIAAYPARC